MGCEEPFSLDSQLRAVLKHDPQARFDLVAHSLGGVVESYWASNYATSGMLNRVHALITFDSPVQGSWAGVAGDAAAGLDAVLIQQIFTGAAGSDLWPWSAVMLAIRDGSHGTTARLPSRVFTISNSRDVVVNRFESWLDKAKENKKINQCESVDKGCHGTVLHDTQAVTWAASWITTGSGS